MLNFNHFITAAEHNTVLTNDGAAADGVNADLVCRTLFTAFVTIVDILGIIGQCLGNSIRQHQRSTAGRVKLLVVVRFHNLDVVILTENGRALSQQIHQQVDANGHIARTEDWNLLGSCLNLSELLG